MSKSDVRTSYIKDCVTRFCFFLLLPLARKKGLSDSSPDSYNTHTHTEIEEDEEKKKKKKHIKDLDRRRATCFLSLTAPYNARNKTQGDANNGQSAFQVTFLSLSLSFF